jgi:hypothetical protein
MQNLHQSTQNHEILYAEKFSKDEQVVIRPVLRKTKKFEDGGLMKIKKISTFCGDESRTVSLRQMMFGIVKDHRHTYNLYLNRYSL